MEYGLKYLRAVANRWFGGDMNRALRYACKHYPRFQKYVRGVANLWFNTDVNAAVKAIRNKLK